MIFDNMTYEQAEQHFGYELWDKMKRTIHLRSFTPITINKVKHVPMLSLYYAYKEVKENE